MKSEKLKGCEISLVDRNPDNLARMTRLAERVNRDWDCEMKLKSSPITKMPYQARVL